jgi:hypothetical protein
VLAGAPVQLVTCNVNANVQGSLSIGSGATVAVVGSDVTGSVIANGAATLTVCGSTLARLLTVGGRHDRVHLGWPAWPTRSGAL